MGAVLDCAKDIRQNKESPSRQAYKAEKKLEKDKDEGVRMIPAVYDKINGRPEVNTILYHGKFKIYHGLELNVIIHYLHRNEHRVVFVSPSPSSQFGVVPFELRDEIPEILQRDFGYNGSIGYMPSPKLKLAYEMNSHLN